MEWTKYRIVLAVTMLITGSINTLSTKWADNTHSVGKDGQSRPYDHPFLQNLIYFTFNVDAGSIQYTGYIFQAVGMFMGELSCLAVFHILKAYKKSTGNPMDLGNQSFNPLIFLPPAMCDMCGTSLMYMGLTLTYASSFQMLRGAVIVFTALLSVAFLGRVVKAYMWVGILAVICGLTVVGLSDVLFDQSTKDSNGVITGDLLIVMAQIIAATQMVYEEKYVIKHNVPALQAVGWEGFFGFTVLGLLLIPFYYIPAGTKFGSKPEGRLEDSIDAIYQIGNSSIVAIATFGNIVSIAFFNFAGISVTKEMSATTRMVLDSCRTLVIWVFALAVQWQNFQYLQIIGFLLLCVGMCLYNDIIFLPFMRKHHILLKPVDEFGNDEEKRPIINSGHVQDT